MSKTGATNRKPPLNTQKSQTPRLPTSQPHIPLSTSVKNGLHHPLIMGVEIAKILSIKSFSIVELNPSN
jgi:hypothetical protein